MPEKSEEQRRKDQESKNRYLNAANAAKREIGDIPLIQDWSRRESTRDSLRAWCETYEATTFSMGWSDDHLRAIARIEESVLHGALFAFAMPRGSGKTSLVRAATRWAICHGHSRYVFIIGANIGKAQDSLDSIKTAFRFSDILHEDFPEVTHAARALAGIANRASGQTCHDVSTMIEWGKDRMVLPTVPYPENHPDWAEGVAAATSGSIIGASGLTGDGIRGSLVPTASGESIRPDMVLLDDPQTDAPLDLNTPIPTPEGFKLMGDIEAGDIVFDEKGQKTRCLATSRVFTGRKCYEVEFDDGAKVVCDGEHSWVTSTALQRTNARRRKAPNPKFNSRPQCAPQPTETKRTTLEIASSLRGEGGRNNHSIPIPRDIEFGDQQEMLLHPYVMGYWLGDGDTRSGRITTMDGDTLDAIRGLGYELSPPQTKPGNLASSYTVYGISKHLRAHGVLGNKHIPDAYLYADRESRLDLLQGLMDSDGSITTGTKGVKGTRCTFVNTNRRIAYGVLHLCRSLGIKAKIRRKPPSDKGNLDRYLVTFITDLPVFRIGRKAVQVPDRTKPSTRRRYIVSVTEVPSRPVKCITVESESHQFLCGEGMVPTCNSAASPSQNETRLRLIMGAVLGMAGPGKSISAMMPCTVIQPGDMVDRILDPETSKEWRGERTKLLRTMPKNLGEWEKYRDVYEQDMLRQPPNFDISNAYYLEHREVLDEGAEAAWEERKKETETSAIQHAMHLYFRDELAFWAEYQNDPQATDFSDEGFLTADEIASKVTGVTRGVVPPECTHVTSFIDVQGEVLYWMVVAWSNGFGGQIIDYGTWPDQKRRQFTLRSLQRTLSDEYPGTDTNGAIYAGLLNCIDYLWSREWTTVGGDVMRMSFGMVDAGWGDSKKTVYRACRDTPHAANISPSHGRGIKAGNMPIDEWPKKPGEQAGHCWRRRVTKGEGVRHVLYDTNIWKTLVNRKLAVMQGGFGDLSLYKASIAHHRQLAEHIKAEPFVRTSGYGRELIEFKPPTAGRDNHWFDCLVGSAVAASIAGVSATGHEPLAKPGKKKRISLSKIQKEKRGN